MLIGELILRDYHQRFDIPVKDYTTRYMYNIYKYIKVLC